MPKQRKLLYFTSQLRSALLLMARAEREPWHQHQAVCPALHEKHHLTYSIIINNFVSSCTQTQTCRGITGWLCTAFSWAHALKFPPTEVGQKENANFTQKMTTAFREVRVQRQWLAILSEQERLWYFFVCFSYFSPPQHSDTWHFNQNANSIGFVSLCIFTAGINETYPTVPQHLTFLLRLAPWRGWAMLIRLLN